jgi:hypothetical protein
MAGTARWGLADARASWRGIAPARAHPTQVSARTRRVLYMAAAGGISQACARLNMTGLRAATSGTPAGAGGCWRRRAEELRAGTSGGGW